MTAIKPWILGLDLSPRSDGALVFAAWLRSAGATVIGVHALEAWANRFIVEVEQAEASVRDAVAERCARLGVAPLTSVSLAHVLRAEEGLLQAAATAGGGIVIGRAAPRGERSLVRLGQVARRVLRELPGPVVVVPPDLVKVAPGPILLATDLTPSSDAAAHLAIELAATQGRPLEVVHVGEPRHSELIDERDPAWQRQREIYRAGIRASAETWAAGLGIGDRTRHVLFGDCAEEIAAAATRLQAALIVTGSRRLGLIGRVFSTSTASSLAGLAECPVAVVPPV
jgi:nucleotide-binding universal stress UspA family protein